MEKKLFTVPVYIYFIVLALIILVLFPREGKFRYLFTEGKPWKYGLLTAPMDFPIYKTQAELKKEQDSIAQFIKPYFLKDKSIENDQIDRFRKEKNEIPSMYAAYIEKSLRSVYEKGIISIANSEFLYQNNYSEFMLIDDNVATECLAADMFTVRSAYTYILDNIPPYLKDRSDDLSMIDGYLTENVKYDKDISEKVKDDLLKQISPANGMVQAGEKIIDRGEIVDKQTFSILSSLRQVSDTAMGVVQRQGLVLAGAFILLLVFMLFFFLYLYYFRKEIYRKNKDVFFLFLFMGIFIIITELCVNYQLFNVYIIPYAIIPIVIRTFFDSRTARVAHNTAIMVCSLMVQYPFDFIVLQFSTSMVVVYSLTALTKRSQLIQCSFFVLLTYVVVYVGLVLSQEGSFAGINWMMFVYFGVNFVFLMFTYSFIYMIERLFGYVSGVTLVELSDINAPILRKLSEVAPGTFQHSLQVSILGSVVAEKVGANPLLIRTGALFHDVGKIENPAYFVENQIGDNNPHCHLPYEKSAEIIIKHVPDGEKLAKKYNIPEMVIDFIRTHHGKGVAKYFYNSYKNEFPDAPIDISKFSYPGPNPRTKEEAILMMADSVEAASRSLKDYSEESISNLVNKIIDGQLNDGLLSDAPLTFKHIKIIKEVFIEKLINMFHSRITYPELKEDSEDIKEEDKTP